MKTRNKPLIAATVILSVCSVAFFALITYDYLNPESFGIVDFSVFEKEAYALGGVCYLLVYHQMIRKSEKSRKWKILMGTGVSAVCTVQVILLNTMWHYISFNEVFDWVSHARYLGFIIQDLTYLQHGNVFKYPLVFVLMFAGCCYDAFIFDWVTDLYERVFSDDEQVAEKEDENDN